ESRRRRRGSCEKRRWFNYCRCEPRLGRGLVLGMPGFLTFLGAAGTAAMIWVGGAIIVHGLETYGVHFVAQAISYAAAATARALPSAGGLVKWIVTAFLSGIAGLVVGTVSVPVVGFAIAPLGNY